MTPTLVSEFLENGADLRPEKIALICDGRQMTYADIEREANRLANTLIVNGVQRGDRIILYLANSAELVIGIFATLKAGGVFVVINPTIKQDKLAYILRDCQARVLISWPARADLITRLSREPSPVELWIITPGEVPVELPAHIRRYDEMLDSRSSQRPPKVNIDLDLACLIYTSGTTGEPKGVMSDHSNVVFAVDSIISYLENSADDVVIDVLPLSFDYGLYQLLMVFRFGGTLVLERGYAYPAATLARIQDERVTGFPGVPTIFSVLLDMDTSHYDLSSIRYMTNTAAALSLAQIKRLREKFPGVRFYSMYGLTETKRTLYLPPDQLDKRPDSVGIAIPGTEVWLENEQGTRLGPGETGELVVRGRHVMRGYWGDAEATAHRFRPGRISSERVCHTGDLFRMDDEGFCYFVTRKDDIIKSRGEKVAPKEVEDALYKLDRVREAAVVGIPDPTLGQAVKAFIVTNGSELTEAEVLRHCRENLEDFLVPKYVEFRDSLPKTTSGKITKTGLS